MARISRRIVLKGGSLALLSPALLWSCSESGREGEPGRHGSRLPDFGPFEPEGGRVVVDSVPAPEIWREAPMLSEGVKAGQLPPVDARIGRDPIVVEPLEEIGRYGGTLRRAFVGPGDALGIVRVASGPDSFLYWDAGWNAVRPNIARGFDVSPDGRILTLLLRRGMRWSDGQPFTADDVTFWYRHMYLDRRVVAAASSALVVDNEPVQIEKIDDYAVCMFSPRPFDVLVELLASLTDIGGPAIYGKFGLGGFAPAHYLRQFHADFSSEREANAVAREAGYANWSIYLKNRNDWTLNPDLPVVSPWRVTAPINSRKFRLERNPYSIWIDTAGNQLPYIDRISNVFCSGPDVVNRKAVAGKLDFQNRHLDITQLPLLLKNRERAGYDVYLDPYEGTDLGFRINLDYRADSEIGSLLGSATFRRALSLAVDRGEINETMMLGLGSPSASLPGPNSRYYPGPEWATKWATLDVPEANRLLDGLGLAKKDADGFRLRRDGGGRLRLSCQTVVSHFNYPAVAEMVRVQWQAIGIDLDVRVLDPTLWLQRCMSGEVQLAVHSTGCEDPYAYPDLLFPYTSGGVGSIMGVELARWFQSYGRAGTRPPDEIVEMMQMWREGRTAERGVRIEFGAELIRRHIDLVLSIGLVSRAFAVHGIHVANKDLANVPRRVLNTQIIMSPANALPMTFFFRNRRI